MSDPLRAEDVLPPSMTGFRFGGVSVRRGTSRMSLEGPTASRRIFGLPEKRRPVLQGIGGILPADCAVVHGKSDADTRPRRARRLGTASAIADHSQWESTLGASCSSSGSEAHVSTRRTHRLHERGSSAA